MRRITPVSLIRFGTVTHSINMGQRFLSLSFSGGSGSLTVTGSANANLAPPGILHALHCGHERPTFNRDNITLLTICRRLLRRMVVVRMLRGGKIQAEHKSGMATRPLGNLCFSCISSGSLQPNFLPVRIDASRTEESAFAVTGLADD